MIADADAGLAEGVSELIGDGDGDGDPTEERRSARSWSDGWKRRERVS